LAVPTSIGPVYAQDARETIGGAVGLADLVGGEEGRILLDAATSAFQHATVVTAVVAAVVLVAMAALVVLGVRSRPQL
jgi:MFS transporter, DHA2 family, multidrug resistance protein